jgi:hypothetical protein
MAVRFAACKQMVGYIDATEHIRSHHNAWKAEYWNLPEAVSGYAQ